ncbi:hypothetical protein [Marinomonas balearica]|uniref:Cutinase n=1 Tax=Marinomonas balearica TaxID=491947 RepID=A0A4V3CH06_9GAMM|nr:hypothetical protein [Marinomonas balearica]TDO99742.1 cutinase [Marinomonas balearica]
MTGSIQLPKVKTSLLLIALIAALYAPIKDLIKFGRTQVATESISLKSISFGNSFPWQSAQQVGFVKASASLSSPQKIFTKLVFENPTNEVITYRKIWLTFAHESGAEEYTTDYSLYDPNTRQRLIGQSVEVGPNSKIEVLAAYRFIPGYSASTPESVSISWEKQNKMRGAACDYSLPQNAMSSFNNQCL